MFLGGIFRKWFGKRFGTSPRMRAARLRLIAEAQSDEDNLRDQNLPGGGFEPLDPDQVDGSIGPGNSDDQTTPPQALQGRLALDGNNDDVIDSEEAGFFHQAPAPLDALMAFDTDQDGLLDLADPQWQSFGIWDDANQDQQFQTGEFQSLAQLGIARINLDAGLTDGKLSVTQTDGTQRLLALSASV